MKNPTTYQPYLADWGEADMREHPMGSYVQLFDYLQLYKAYEEAKKNKAAKPAAKEKAVKKVVTGLGKLDHIRVSL